MKGTKQTCTKTRDKTRQLYHLDNINNCNHKITSSIMRRETKYYIYIYIYIYIHIQGKRVQLPSCFYWFLAWLILKSWVGRRYVPTKRRDISELHGIITHKTVLFIVMAVRTSNPTYENFNTVLPSTPRYPSDLFPSHSPNKIWYSFLISHACHRSTTSYPAMNNIRGLKLLPSGCDVA
jgi:hypothetical protein